MHEYDLPPVLKSGKTPNVLPEPVGPEGAMRGAEGMTSTTFKNLNVKPGKPWTVPAEVTAAERAAGFGTSKGGVISSITSGGTIKLPADGGPGSKNSA